MWIKLPGIVANAAVLILDIFVILMIAALFLHQQTAESDERDDYAFFHDIGGVLFRGRGIQPEERPGAYVCGERTV